MLKKDKYFENKESIEICMHVWCGGGGGATVGRHMVGTEAQSLVFPDLERKGRRSLSSVAKIVSPKRLGSTCLEGAFLFKMSHRIIRLYAILFSFLILLFSQVVVSDNVMKFNYFYNV